MSINPVIRNMQRRLRRWELEHLRKLMADMHDLHDRLERAEAQAEWASESAEFWQSYAIELQRERYEDGCESKLRIGLTQDGGLMVLNSDAAAQETPSMTPLNSS